jgi:hypothetical protein
VDLIKKEEIEGSVVGNHSIPFEILERIRPDVLLDASATYAKLVADHPNYEIGMVQDTEAKSLYIYWTKIV